MSKLSDPHATIVREQIKRLHASINDGTLDRATANDALNKLDELAGNKDVPGNPADDPYRNRSTDPASYAANPDLDPNHPNRNLDPNRDPNFGHDPARNPGIDPASRNPNTGNPTRDPNQPNRNPAGNPETPAARAAREGREGRETPEARAAREAREGR